jgi:hypothetical protein
LLIGSFGKELSPEIHTFWKEVQDKIFEDNREKILEYAQKDFSTFLTVSSKIKPEDVIDQIVDFFSLDHLFISTSHDIFNIFFSSFAVIIGGFYLRKFQRDRSDEEYAAIKNYYLTQAKNLDKLILKQELPCFSSSLISTSFILGPMFKEHKNKDASVEDFDIGFGIWCIYAVYCEIYSNMEEKNRFIEEIDILPTLLKEIIQMRLKIIPQENLSKKIYLSGFHVDQKTMILNWVKEEINFVK